MNLDNIQLENLSKNFEYAKACLEIDAINDIDNLKTISKAYLKLYLKQQEVISNLASSF